MNELEDAERKSKLQEAKDHYMRLQQQNNDIAEREVQIRDELNTMEREQQKWKSLVEEYKKSESEAQNKLVDIDKDYDKMASKESLYLEKSVSFSGEVERLPSFSRKQVKNYATWEQCLVSLLSAITTFQQSKSTKN